MKASRVHAVIAAGLEHPHLLARWQREPDLLRRCGVEPDALDLDALWKFAGLTAKVRHNGLRADLPLTFRLLHVAGLEIEVFAAYAAFRTAGGARYADTTAARAQDLSNFLEHWLDFTRREHALLWDVLRYELALARLSKLTAPVQLAAPAPGLTSAASLPARPRAASVPRVCGHISLHEMRCDPRQVAALLQEKSPRLADVTMGSRYFCYWRQGAAAELHILELDELGFYLLSLADGQHSVADLSRLIGGGSRPAKGLLTALGELASVGILAFTRTSEQVT
ncbi:MAG TPA: hypothetical protein VF525_00785 [Pyrinomonadaceae bacterium]|jgi:hypothetical protein